MPTGVLRSAVYRLRATSPAFSNGWQTAIATGYDELEFRLLKTARFGMIKPVKRPDGSMGRATEFDDAQGLKLLMAYKASIEKTRGEAAPDPLAAKGAREQLVATLEQIRQRLDTAIGPSKQMIPRWQRRHDQSSAGRKAGGDVRRCDAALYSGSPMARRRNWRITGASGRGPNRWHRLATGGSG